MLCFCAAGVLNALCSFCACLLCARCCFVLLVCLMLCVVVVFFSFLFGCLPVSFFVVVDFRCCALADERFVLIWFVVCFVVVAFRCCALFVGLVEGVFFLGVLFAGGRLCVAAVALNADFAYVCCLCEFSVLSGLFVCLLCVVSLCCVSLSVWMRVSFLLWLLAPFLFECCFLLSWFLLLGLFFYVFGGRVFVLVLFIFCFISLFYMFYVFYLFYVLYLCYFVLVCSICSMCSICYICSICSRLCYLFFVLYLCDLSYFVLVCSMCSMCPICSICPIRSICSICSMCYTCAICPMCSSLFYLFYCPIRHIRSMCSICD